MKLTRDDVTIVNDNAPWFGPAEKVWHIRIAGVDYRIIARRDDTTVLAGDDAWRTAAYPSTALGYPDGADEDMQTMTVAYDPDHWWAIDHLLAWLSIDVERGWSRPVLGVSYRTDLPPVEIVALFRVHENGHTQVWDARKMGDHFESYRYDEGDDDAVFKTYPCRVYVRVEDSLVDAQYDYVHITDDHEIRILVRGEIVAAARY